MSCRASPIPDLSTCFYEPERIEQIAALAGQGFQKAIELRNIPYLCQVTDVLAHIGVDDLLWR